MLTRFTAPLLIVITAVVASAIPAQAQVKAGYQNREEREIYGTNPGDSGTILDATNPMDLINRIQQAGAMDDATPPSDAIDAALKAYQKKDAPSSQP
ncbi:MAG: hypothetical protein ISQ52_11090 [Synechococcus sp. BS307-5m-G38]|nr:hypothetical protein [Synechococcus sp. BS307-5m-G38]